LNEIVKFSKIRSLLSKISSCSFVRFFLQKNGRYFVNFYNNFLMDGTLIMSVVVKLWTFRKNVSLKKRLLLMFRKYFNISYKNISLKI